MSPRTTVCTLRVGNGAVTVVGFVVVVELWSDGLCVDVGIVGRMEVEAEVTEASVGSR